MKLVIISLVIACGFGEKLDRTYLPPENAANAGGSPGSLTAPFGSLGPSRPQGLGKPSVTADFAQPSGPNGLNPSSRPVYGTPSGPAGFDKPSGSSGFPGGFGQPSGPSQSIQQSESPAFRQQPTGSTTFRQPSSASQFGQSPDSLAAKPFDLPNAGQPAGPSQFSAPSGPDTFRQQTASSGIPSGKAFEPSSQPKFGPSAAGSFDQTSGLGGEGSQGAPGYPGQDYQQPERPQAAADRNAEILRYDNENDGENFAFSFETSNGIAAEESGVATDGVRAQGGYSYTGDDGQFYQVTYTADENGFVPQGDHLPTSPPIPDEILKSIEENARAAAAGTQEGAYNPEEEESDGPQQNIGGGSTSFNQPQGPGQPFNQYGAPNFNQPQGQVQPSGQPNKIPTFNQPQGQYGTPSGDAQDQKGNPNFNAPIAEIDQQNQIPSSDRQYNAPGNTLPRGKASEPLSYNQGGNAPSGGYTYNQPQNQEPKQQSGSPRNFLSSSRPVGFANVDTQQPQQYNSPVNTQKQGQISQKSLPSYNQGGSIGYNYNQPQNQAQDSKQRPGSFNTDINPTRPGGLSNVATQGPTPQRYNRPVNTQQGQEPQQSGSPSYNQGGSSSSNGYNYDQPQNQPQGSKQGPRTFNTGANPTRPGGSPNVVTQGQTPQRYNGPVNTQQQGQLPQQSGSPSYNQDGSAASTGYNYDQPQNEPQSPKQSPRLFNTDVNPTRPGGSLNIGNQGQAPQQSGASSFDMSGSTPDTGYNYNQRQNTSPQQSAPRKGAPVGAAAFPNAGIQGQLNQPGQGRAFGNQPSGKPSPGFPKEGSAGTESQAHSGYQYNRPAAQGASQFEFNQDSTPSKRPQNNQPFGTQGPDGPANQPESGRLPHSESASFRPSFTGQTSQSSFGPASSIDGKVPSSPISTGGQKSFSSAGPRAFMTQSAPYQYNQPESPQIGSQSQRPSSQPGFKSGSSHLNQDKSEFGGPREPPSFSPEEGYKY